MPIFTYRCPEGHEWDELRSGDKTETSEGTCPTCGQATDLGLQSGQSVPTHGVKVPSQFGVVLRGRGFTPTFYPNRKENK